MAPFDKLKPFSFSGITFPYESYRVIGGLREHVHEYPHSPGGAPEKLGRKLYEVRVTALFNADLWSPKYRDLYARLEPLRALFEDQVTEDLHIPHIGTIKAYAAHWEEGVTNTNRSGVTVEFAFREDQESAFLVLQAVQINSKALADKTEDFAIKAENTVPAKPSIFDSITAAANSVLAFKDQYDLYGSLVESKLLALTAILSEADQQLNELNDPSNYEVLDAMHALWQAAQQLDEDLRERGAKLRSYVTPITMPLQQVSNAIFGDSTKAAELLQLNALEDPLAIPANTTIRYYAVS